eukprot:g79567.t1
MRRHYSRRLQSEAGETDTSQGLWSNLSSACAKTFRQMEVDMVSALAAAALILWAAYDARAENDVINIPDLHKQLATDDSSNPAFKTLLA